MALCCRNIHKNGFLHSIPVLKSLLPGLSNMTVFMFVWNLPVSIGLLCSIFWNNNRFILSLPIPNGYEAFRETKMIKKIPKGLLSYFVLAWFPLASYRIKTLGYFENILAISANLSLPAAVKKTDCKMLLPFAM